MMLMMISRKAKGKERLLSSLLGIFGFLDQSAHFLSLCEQMLVFIPPTKPTYHSVINPLQLHFYLLVAG